MAERFTQDRRLSAAAPPPFVGREAELEALLAGLADALEGRGRLFLISGEPGIGKSRLADELARRAEERGVLALWGRCWEAGGAPAYWPWVQSLRAYLRRTDPEALAREIGIGAADVARVLPELRELLPDVPEPPTLDPESARFRLFDAATSFLRNAAASAPLMLVLDDLHAADTPSLLLLEFVAAEMSDTPLVVVATYRDVDPALDYPLVSTLGQLARQRVTRHLPLRGLDEEEVVRLIAETTGVTPPPGLASTIHRETEGNPLFVGEVARLLVAEGRLGEVPGSFEGGLTVPEGVRQVISRRTAGLSPGCRSLLTKAAVLGREFDLDLLEALAGGEDVPSMEILGEAVRARVVMETPAAPGRMRFAHALIRDALYEDLSPAQRAQLHGEAGDALRRRSGADPDAHLAEMAHHFFEAIPAVPPSIAVEYARRAGDRAVGLLAYEEAIRLYEMALTALARHEDDDEASRCELELALGEARLKAGDGAGSKETFLRAAQRARRLRSADLLARAALGYGGRFAWLRAGTDEHLIPLLEEALETMGEADSPLRARVLARLAGALRDELSRERRDTLSARALDVARRLGDLSTLAYALAARYTAVWGPDTNEELMAIAEEIAQIAAEAREPERALEGRLLRHNILMTRGGVAEAKAELEAARRLADELRQPVQRWYVASYSTTILLLEGRFAEAERAIEETLALGERAQGMDAQVAYRLQLAVLRREQGRLNEVEAVLRRSVDEYPWYPLFRCVLAHLEAELGRVDEARESLERLAPDRFAAIPMDNEWLFAMTFLSEAVASLDHAEYAETLYAPLLPYAELNAFSQPEVGTGPVARYLGLLATAQGRWHEAATHFEDALDGARRTGARPWGARAKHDYARMLLGRGGPGDAERAADLLQESREEARFLGMAALHEQVSGLLEPIEEPRAIAARPQRDGEAVARYPAIFRREGEYWAIAFEGDAFRLRDTKGLRYLARLLRSAGAEVHVLDLVAEGGEPRDHARRREDREADLSLKSGGESEALLDPQARAAYRRRLEELQEDVEEAESFGDPERAARAKEEMEFVARELAGATGLGGRSRRAPSASERARQSVTKALKSAATRIAEQSPALGRHLDATLHTGTFCSYVPDPRLPVAWRL